MRKVKSDFFISLGGVVESPGMYAEVSATFAALIQPDPSTGSSR